MLGVVRIYGRKVQYLMDDCRETRERISLAFRPGMVDLPDDQKRASRNAITFESAPIDTMDIFDWSFVPPPPSGEKGLHTAPLTQTNLRSKEYGAFNFGRPRQPSIYGDQSSRQGSHDTSLLETQDFQPMDLGLGLDDFDMSIEVGRDAASERRSRSKSLQPMRLSEGPGPEADGAWDESFEPMDLGLGDLPELEMDTERRRRETSALTTPPPPDELEREQEVSQRVAKRIAAGQAQGQSKPKRVRIVHADEELELRDSEFQNPNDEDCDIIGIERFIPANPEASRLRDIMDDPASHFLPTFKSGSDMLIYSGPRDLAPELTELFSFSSNVLRRVRDEPPAPAPSAPPAKRQRTEPAPIPTRIPAPVPEDLEVEVGRRESRAPSEIPLDLGLDFGDSFGGDMTMDTIDNREREPSLALSLKSLPPLIQGNTLSIFDKRTESQLASSQVPQTQTQEEDKTSMAMGVLRRELEAVEDTVKFDKLAKGASKRSATAFFFELLVLGTRDVVKLKQDGAFGPIEVSGKQKLFAQC